MPLQTPSQPDQDRIEQQKRDLNERYLTAMVNLAVSQQQSKINKTESWVRTGSLVNDFFTYSLITLGVMAAVLASDKPTIGSKPLFYVSLTIQALVVIFASIVRLYIDGHSTKTKDRIYEEFNIRINKVDTYRLGMTNSDEAEQSRVRESMNSAFAPEYEFQPDGSNWILKNGQKAIAVAYITSFLIFILAIILRVDINA